MILPPCLGAESGSSSLQPLVMARGGKEQSQDPQRKVPALGFTAGMLSPPPAPGLVPNPCPTSARAPAAGEETEDLRPNFPLNTYKLKRAKGISHAKEHLQQSDEQLGTKIFIDSFILAPFKSSRGILLSTMGWFLPKTKSPSRAEPETGCAGEPGLSQTALLGLREPHSDCGA